MGLQKKKDLVSNCWCLFFKCFRTRELPIPGFFWKTNQKQGTVHSCYFKNLEEPSVSIKNWQFPGAQVFDFLKLFENHCYVCIKTGCFDILRTVAVDCWERLWYPGYLPGRYLPGRWYPPNASCKAHGVEVPFCFPAKGKRTTPVGRCSGTTTLMISDIASKQSSNHLMNSVELSSLPLFSL